MTERDEELEQLLAATNHRAAFINQVEHAKQQFIARTRMAWQGHLFQLTPEFLAHVGLQLLDVKMKEDKGVNQKVILLDEKTEPVMIEDLEEFVDAAEEAYQEALNDYFDKYSDLMEAKTAAEVYEAA